MSEKAIPRLGIDLGGSKIQGVVLDEADGILASRRVPVPRDDYPGTISTIIDLVQSLEGSIGCPSRVGVGSPGSISPATGRHRNSNATWLIGQDLRGDLTRSLDRPIRMDNDANCLTLAEARGEAAAGARVVAGVVLGTGVGSGLVVDGEIVGGRNAIGSELGHCPLPWPDASERPGPRCYCGRRGCLETFLCGAALSRDYLEAAGESRDAREIAALTSSGDAIASRCVARYCDRLARGLALLVNILDPDVIVLGGGLANLVEIFEQVPRHLPGHVFSDSFATEILPAAYGDLSGACGAALLWPTETRS